MTIQKECEQKVRDVFEKTKSHKKMYTIHINNIEIEIFPNVFSPAYFTDSTWFAQNIPKIVGQHSFLEIGTGTGIIALCTRLHGAQVSATDINPDAVKNARYNFKKHNLTANFYYGDMYEPIPSNKKFDFVFWNHPFNR